MVLVWFSEGINIMLWTLTLHAQSLLWTYGSAIAIFFTLVLWCIHTMWIQSLGLRYFISRWFKPSLDIRAISNQVGYLTSAPVLVYGNFVPACPGAAPNLYIRSCILMLPKQRRLNIHINSLMPKITQVIHRYGLGFVLINQILTWLIKWYIIT